MPILCWLLGSILVVGGVSIVRHPGAQSLAFGIAMLIVGFFLSLGAVGWLLLLGWGLLVEQSALFLWK